MLVRGLRREGALDAGALDLDLRVADVVPLGRGAVTAIDSAAETASVELRLVEPLSLDRKFLARVARVVEERITDRGFAVDDLARAVSMSRSQLHRKLMALIGQSPGVLIRTMRLQRAADLIRSGNRTLSQIASIPVSATRPSSAGASSAPRASRRRDPGIGGRPEGRVHTEMRGRGDAFGAD